VSEDSLLERVTTAAECLALETLPSDKAGKFYEEATRGRSASHHLQVKAALSLLYHVLGSKNPFAECPAPKFAPEKTELRYHSSSQLGELLRELRDPFPSAPPLPRASGSDARKVQASAGFRISSPSTGICSPSCDSRIGVQPAAQSCRRRGTASGSRFGLQRRIERCSATVGLSRIT
jgi:hypothetical protein